MPKKEKQELSAITISYKINLKLQNISITFFVILLTIIEVEICGIRAETQCYHQKYLIHDVIEGNTLNRHHIDALFYFVIFLTIIELKKTI